VSTVATEEGPDGVGVVEGEEEVPPRGRGPRGILDRLSGWWPRGAGREEWLRELLPRLLFLLLLLGYTIVMYRLVWQRHDRFGTFDYDLGMYDQGIWLLSRGRGFMTVRGMHVFGHHANLGYLLLVPFYWLGAGPQFLDLLNTLGVVACAVPLYLMGRKGLRSDWAGLLIAVAYLFHYVPQWMIHETFHPENLAAPFILFAVWFAVGSERPTRWRAYWICLAAAMIWKEDVALVVMMLGIAVMLMTREVRRGLLTMAAGAVWFIVAVKGIIPAFSPEGAVFDGLFGTLGTSATDVVTNSLRDPSRAVSILQEHGAEQGALDLMRPYAFTGIVSPHLLLLGAPQHIVNFLSVQSFTWETKFHYAMFPFIAVTLASVRTVVTRSRVLVSWLLIAAMLGGVWLTRDMGVGPWAEPSRQGYWPGVDEVVQPALRAAVAKVPDDAVVSAPYYLVPHLSHRDEVYTFPNPWKSSNFGPGTNPLHRNPDRVDVLVMRPDQLGEEDRAIFDHVAESGQLDKVWERAGIQIWVRTGYHLRPTG
jgi:uncharacterized membrane protein